MKDADTIWVVVEIWRGLLKDVKAFSTEEIALTYFREIETQITPRDDEVVVTKVKLNVPMPVR